MKRILNRIKSKCGETLVETMVATLIFTFGSIIMLSMISSSVKINNTAKKADEKYYTDMIKVEQANNPLDRNPMYSPAITFKLDYPGSNLSQKVAVDVYGAEDGLYAYYPEEGGR